MSCGNLSRREVRSLLFQVFYAVDAFGYDVSAREIIREFNAELEQDLECDGEIARTVDAIASQRDKYNQFLIPLLANWKLERIGCCTRLVLHIALWELQETEIPSTIVINEAIELAKNFCEKDAYKFVNGVLDQVVKKLETEKVNADS